MIKLLKIKINKFLNNSIFEKTICILIVLNLIVFILDSMNSFHNRFGNYAYKFEVISVIIFTLEYFMRIFSIEKITDVFKPFMIIDLFAILPFYISEMFVNTVFLRMFRISRLIRILKIGRYSIALKNIFKAFKAKKEELILTFSVFIFGVLFMAILMYIAENEAQPFVFSSIPKCLYFSIITFTTIGYGDVTPITTIGKIISSLSAIFGVGLHGLFIGIIGSAFIQAFRKE